MEHFQSYIKDKFVCMHAVIRCSKCDVRQLAISSDETTQRALPFALRKRRWEADQNMQILHNNNQ